jgi:hypothetical protein
VSIELFDDIGAIDDEVGGIVARNWPHLLAKLPPEDAARVVMISAPSRHSDELGGEAGLQRPLDSGCVE